MTAKDKIQKIIAGESSTSILILAILFILTLSSAAMFAFGYLLIPGIIIASLIGIIISYLCLRHPLIGLYLITIISFFVSYPSRILNKPIPIATGIEILVLLVFLGTYSQRKYRTQSSLIKTPVSIAFLVYSLFVIIELFNPNMYSVAGWLFFARRLAMFIVLYILAYRLLDDPKKVKTFLKIWFGLSLVSCVYACYQQWFGLLPFEMNFLMSNPHEFNLYFQGGVVRKFSFFADPATFGALAGSCSVFMLILGINEKDKKRKRFIFFSFFIMTLGMIYSGTRSANIMLPAGLCLYALMTISNKTTLITLFIFFIAIIAVLFGPFENASINRMRSTFNSKDESLQVRDINRKYIQPYIYEHPLGGGIFTSGLLGETYNPGHPLAGFPPDSGFLLAAIELGWIGYAITLLVYFLMLYQCVHYYFLTKHKEYRLYICALGISLFTIIISQYSHVTIGQLPGALFFYIALALVVRLKEFGTDKEEKNIL